MLGEGMASFTDTYLTIIALLLFFTTFIGIVVWTYRKSARKHYEEVAKQPLDEGKLK